MRSIKNIPNPRYAFDMAHHFIQKYNIRWFPIDAVDLITHIPRCKLMYVKDLSVKISESTDYILKNVLHGEDGLAIFNPSKNTYDIIINDGIDTPGRILWTMLHEIGHIYLKHLSDFNETSIYRGALPQNVYDALEFEANIFAGEVLASKWLMQHLGISDLNDIMNICNLSFTGAESRLRKILELPSYRPINVDLTISNFDMYSRDITICRSYDELQYPNLTTQNRPVKPLAKTYSFLKQESSCKYCGNTRDLVGSKFCIMCGHNLNDGISSTLPHCDHVNPEYAAFCSNCGNTVYKTKQGFYLEECECE